MIDVLLIGTAKDGPDGDINLFDNLEDIKQIYGWYTHHFVNLTVVTTSITASGNISNYKDIHVYKKTGKSLQQNVVYSPSATGNIIGFTNPGTSGLYYFKYPTIGDENNLIDAASVVLPISSKQLAVMRVPGTKASLDLNDITFYSRYSGTKYNNLQIVVSTGTITIYQYTPYGTTNTYTYLTSSTTLENQINSDYYFNNHDLMVRVNSYPPSLTNGTYFTTGGTDGSISSSNIASVFDTLDMSDIKYICMAGGVSSSVIEEINNYLISNDFLTTVIVGDSSSSSGLSNSEYINYLDDIVESHKNLIHVTGWGGVDDSLTTNKAYPLALIVAGLLNSDSFSPINKPTNLRWYTPIWSESDLDYLQDTKTCFNRFIGANVALWNCVSTDGFPIIATQSTKKIAEHISTRLDDVIGNTAPDIRVLSERLSGLNELDIVRSIEYAISIDLNQIYIDVSADCFGVTERIEFISKTRRER